MWQRIAEREAVDPDKVKTPTDSRIEAVPNVVEG